MAGDGVGLLFSSCLLGRNIGQGGMSTDTLLAAPATLTREDLLLAIAERIEKDIFAFPGETLANSLRCAAQIVHEDFPQATSADFGDAAVTVNGQNGLPLHRQAAMNRWNEAKANCGDEW
jgi:hypothetical protein